MVSLFLALTLYPDVRKQAQAELDCVLGSDRLPTFDDRQRLPYIDALCKELLRWRVVVPLVSSSKDKENTKKYGKYEVKRHMSTKTYSSRVGRRADAFRASRCRT
jgi:cytochrome P450